MGFVIHWNESAMGLHVFPIPIPPPTSLSTRSLALLLRTQLKNSQIEEMRRPRHAGFLDSFFDIWYSVMYLIFSNTFLLEKGRTTHSSNLAWRIPWTEEAGGLQYVELQRVGHDWSNWTCDIFLGFPDGSDGKESAYNARDLGSLTRSLERIWKIPWKRKWQPTRVFLHGEFHGQRSLMGYSSWGRKESVMTEQLTLSLSLHFNIFLNIFNMIVFPYYLLQIYYTDSYVLCHIKFNILDLI